MSLRIAIRMRKLRDLAHISRFVTTSCCYSAIYDLVSIANCQIPLYIPESSFPSLPEVPREGMRFA